MKKAKMQIPKIDSSKSLQERKEVIKIHLMNWMSNKTKKNDDTEKEKIINDCMSQKKLEENSSTNFLEMKKQEDENLQITSSQSMDDLRSEVRMLLIKAKINRTKKNDVLKKEKE